MACTDRKLAAKEEIDASTFAASAVLVGSRDVEVLADGAATEVV